MEKSAGPGISVSGPDEAAPLPHPISEYLKNSVAPLAFCLAIILFSYWSASRSSYIYYWDYRTYWGKTEFLYGLLHSGSWLQAIRVTLGSLMSDYTMLPAVIPALLCLLFGEPTRIKYLLIIVGIYAIPAYLLVGHLANRIMNTGANHSAGKGHNDHAKTFPILFGLPFSLGVILDLMPDIGGIVLMVGAMLIAETLVQQIVERSDMDFAYPQSSIVRTSIYFAVIVCAMFYFRRWYVFSAIGIVAAAHFLIGVELHSAAGNRRDIIRRTLAAITAGALTAILALSVLILDWIKDVGAHNYANLYSSYANSLATDQDEFIASFGLVPVLCAIVFAVAALKFNSNRRLLFILYVSSMVSATAFLQVQSPALQHYYLLMPIFGVGLSGSSYLLSKKLGAYAGLLFSIFLAAGNAGVTLAIPGGNMLRPLFPGFDLWAPKRAAGVSSLQGLGEWLLSPAMKDKKFCVIASSAIINQSIVSEIWQIAPAVPKDTFKHRMLRLGDVDSRDGPPAEAIRSCEIALVGTPAQTHLRPGEQYSVAILHDELVGKTGIGAAYERLPQVFAMNTEVSILAFRRTREISAADYADLVQRYQDYKSSSRATAGR